MFQGHFISQEKKIKLDRKKMLDKLFLELMAKRDPTHMKFSFYFYLKTCKKYITSKYNVLIS